MTDKKEIILKSAEELFIEQGYQRTSLAQIAKLARVSKALVIHHFQTKNNIWDQVLLKNINSHINNQTEVVRDQPIDRDAVLRFIRNRIVHNTTNPKMSFLKLWSFLEKTNGSKWPRDPKQMKNVLNLLRNLQKKGVISNDFSPFILIAFNFCLLDYWPIISKDFSNFFNKRQDQADEEFYQAVLSLFDKILSSDK